MPEILFSLPLYYKKYRQWVESNPRQASDMETTLKWTSYFVAGQLHNSHTASELVYCLSNLLVLHNDRIIIMYEHGCPPIGDVLKVWLTVLEYSEVFLELSSKNIWGVPGMWIVIIIIQFIKCICRLLLLYYYKNSVTECPPITPLSRNSLLQTGMQNNDMIHSHLEAIILTLSRSGKILRKVDGSPVLQNRTWEKLHKTKIQDSILKQKLTGVKLVAETVYICKPLIHLGSVAYFGNNTWKPWMLSLTLDLFSLYLYQQGENQDNNLTANERLLISRRHVSLLLYLLRPPFYEGYSRKSIESVLRGTGRKVPLTHFITKPVLKYLPFWQSIYFYMWSN